MLEGVQTLFHNIGWGQFLHIHVATYVEPTLEFLSTFHPDEETNSITFQMLGENRSLAFQVVKALLGSQVNHTYNNQDPWPANYNEHNFWQQITHELRYSSSSSMASSIIHPCLCLAHQVLTCTIFAHSEVGQTSKANQFFLWCMTCENGPRPGFASFAFTKCYNLMTMDTGDIFIRGLITLIAYSPHFNFISPPSIQKTNQPLSSRHKRAPANANHS